MREFIENRQKNRRCSLIYRFDLSQSWSEGAPSLSTRISFAKIFILSSFLRLQAVKTNIFSLLFILFVFVRWKMFLSLQAERRQVLLSDKLFRSDKQRRRFTKSLRTKSTIIAYFLVICSYPQIMTVRFIITD